MPEYTNKQYTCRTVGCRLEFNNKSLLYVHKKSHTCVTPASRALTTPSAPIIYNRQKSRINLFSPIASIPDFSKIENKS